MTMSIFVLHEFNDCQQGSGSVASHQAVHTEVQLKIIIQSFKKSLWIPFIFIPLFLKHPRPGSGVLHSFVCACVCAHTCVDHLSCKTQGEDLHLCYEFVQHWAHWGLSGVLLLL